MKKLLIALMLLSGTTQADFVYRTPEGIEHYVYDETVKTRDGIVYYVVGIKNKDKEGGTYIKPYSYAGNCQTHYVAEASPWGYYDAVFIPPNTFGRSWLEYACQKRP